MTVRNRGLQVPSEGGDVQYDVVYARAKEPLDMTLLEERFTGYPVHWTAATKTEPRRTRLCTLMGGCPWHATCPPPVWTGYIACWNNLIGKYQIALLSPEAGRKLLEMHVSFVGLRGLRVIFAREKDLPRGRILVGKASHPASLPIPPAFSIQPTLRTLFGVPFLPEEQHEGEEPPLCEPQAIERIVDDRLPWEKGGAS